MEWSCISRGELINIFSAEILPESRNFSAAFPSFQNRTCPSRQNYIRASARVNVIGQDQSHFGKFHVFFLFENSIFFLFFLKLIVTFCRNDREQDQQRRAQDQQCGPRRRRGRWHRFRSGPRRLGRSTIRLLDALGTAASNGSAALEPIQAVSTARDRKAAFSSRNVGGGCAASDRPPAPECDPPL